MLLDSPVVLSTVFEHGPGFVYPIRTKCQRTALSVSDFFFQQPCHTYRRLCYHIGNRAELILASKGVVVNTGEGKIPKVFRHHAKDERYRIRHTRSYLDTTHRFMLTCGNGLEVSSDTNKDRSVSKPRDACCVVVAGRRMSGKQAPIHCGIDE